MEPLREIRNRLLNGWQLSKMHTFEVAARHQSFALAAEELSLSPSAVSHRINQLEEELGIQLFVRSHRKVELTHEGKRVYWALKSSLDTLNQEILDIKNQELSGTLTLYSRPSIAQCWLVPALGDFTRRYPSISLTVLTGNDNVNLQRAGIDLAIYFDDAPSAQLTHHFLMDEEILPVCSPEYAQRHALTNTVINLCHCTLLHDRQAWSNDSGTDEWHSWAQHYAVNLPTSSGIGFDRSDLAVIAAMNHIGVAMGRKRLVQKRLASGELVAPFGDMTVKCHQHYLTLMTAEKADRNDLAYGMITKGLKNLAKELDCVVVLLTQLNRALESRTNKRPLPSDSRDTGQIEQDCDYWVGIHREGAFDDSVPPGETELILRLNRHGNTGTVYCIQANGAIYDTDQQSAEMRRREREEPQSKKKGGF
ncbi:DNA-binding transcriptional regulator DsdC [Escherichia coli]|nr:DNA-binding transcriptional regulator DsdC [Escherichia coli]EHC4335213.1 DNA-binding transcriptional regulator DsdC [Escherichia coli]